MHWSAPWAWLILVVFIVAYVAVFDIHAALTHGLTMSGQFRDWLFNPVIGPFLFGGWLGIFVGLTFHWFEYKGK